MNGGVIFIFYTLFKYKYYLFFIYGFLLKRGYTNNNLPYLIKQNIGDKIYGAVDDSLLPIAPKRYFIAPKGPPFRAAYRFYTYSYKNLLWLYKLIYIIIIKKSNTC